MARRIGMDADATVYRAVITTRYNHLDDPVTEYRGPYDTQGAAQGQVTNAINQAVDYSEEPPYEALPSRASGHVEQGSFTWTRVTEGS